MQQHETKKRRVCVVSHGKSAKITISTLYVDYLSTKQIASTSTYIHSYSWIVNISSREIRD